MATRTMDDVKSGLNSARGAGDAVRRPRRGTIEAGTAGPAFNTTSNAANHHHATRHARQGQTPRTLERGEVELRKADEALARHQAGSLKGSSSSGAGGQRTTPAAASAQSLGRAQNYDEAPPGQPGPDFSATKPAFTRGLSAIDCTAVTSAAATPAGEIPNPMVVGMIKSGGSRARESHLPDLDIRDADVYTSEPLVEQPDDETRGVDEFGPSLSRQETEKGT